MKVAQFCLTLCDPMDYKVNGILQTRILEYSGILQTRIIQGMFHSSGYLPNPGIEPGPPALRVDSLPAELPGEP